MVQDIDGVIRLGRARLGTDVEIIEASMHTHVARDGHQRKSIQEGRVRLTSCSNFINSLPANKFSGRERCMFPTQSGVDLSSGEHVANED